jgi:dipeptidyl aminopeptidase/acylaminoacyl peptidase
MRKGPRVGRIVVGLIAILFIAANLFIRGQVADFVHNTIAEQQERITNEYEAGWIEDSIRPVPVIRYEDSGLNLEEVTVVNDSGMSLNGFYAPSQNGAAVMLLHGATAFPYHMLEEAMMLGRHGYGVLLISVRSHNFGDGDTLSFGCDGREMEDLRAWHHFLDQQAGVEPGKVGLIGQSMGGILVIQYAAQSGGIKAVVAVSAPASLEHTMRTLITAKTGFPPSIARLTTGLSMFWTEREIGCDPSTISPIDWIGEISPRAVYILHGENDPQLPADSGERLYAAAGEPKYYWLCEGSGHHECDTDYPQEYEERIVGFFDDYLLGG